MHDSCALDHCSQTAHIGALEEDEEADTVAMCAQTQKVPGAESPRAPVKKQHTEWRGRAEEALRDLKLISSMLKSGDRQRSARARKVVRRSSHIVT